MKPSSSADTPQHGPASQAIDLGAYFQRIGYHGFCAPTFEVLQALMRHHMASIPFEAVDVMRGQGVDLDPGAVDRKMIHGRRGGYCFEHTSLFRRVLQALGFALEPHLARVWIHGGSDAPAATHASLKVEADGRLWLVDVGFGGFLSNQPLAWRPNEAQPTAFGTFRLVETRDGYMLENRYQDGWSPLYEILDFDWQPIDFEMANHYVATHPQSLFKRELMIARTEDKVRYSLSNNRFTTRFAHGMTQERVLDETALADTLAATFGLPVGDTWQAMIAAIVARGDGGG
ncbi:arylamine N-acetyltransferase [Salinisphaera sp.]|uniref:arylamine N-acetyltransferase family protein n=1 Tax=Salinisphaera sp. TaxID=1914330 RepID=UPI000C483F38|nr:arylamine N-acetyltransferase [Salinisphaera sp.]MBS64368.1 arylamine N-acetyltransferase [Salinisphaera sp.]